MKTGAKNQWMVKSGGLILGPYQDGQVADLLRDRVIVPLDEISLPCDRWRHIRDLPVFAKVVEELRIRNIRGVSDETVTQGNEETGGTATITPSAINDDLTEDLNLPKPKTVQDILFQSIDDLATPVSKKSPDLFTHEGDRFVKQQAAQSSKWVWVVTLVVILATSGFVVFRQFVAKPIQNRTLLDDKMGVGIEALESGDYGRALEAFKAAYAVAPEENTTYLYLGILQIQVENQPFQGRKLLENLLNREDKDLKRVLTGIGLAFLKEGDTTAAEKNFNRALDVDPLFKPALINLGAAAIAKEDWAKANNHLQLALKEGSNDGAEVLMLIEAFVQLFKKEKDRRYLTEAIGYIDSYLAQARNYAFEIFVGRSYLASLLGDKNSVYASIERLLDSDSRETESHRQNLFVSRSTIGWNVISQWCLQMTQDLEAQAHVGALEALCLLKARNLVEANRKIDDALAQAPKDPLVLSAYAEILLATGAADRASVAADKALENDIIRKYEQPLRQKARVCGAKDDLNCQAQYWRELFVKNPRSLAAVAGLSQVQLAKNNIGEAKKLLLRGLQLSPSYTPFFSINKAISLTEDRAKARGL